MQRKIGSRGFTLVELLVVISIIVMLIAILLPSLSRARSQGAQADCRSKVRSFGIALQTYFSEWNATVPLNGLIMPKGNGSISGIPAMYQGTEGISKQVQAAEAKVPDQWRVEFGALWSYVGGVPFAPNTTLPLPATPTMMAKRYICKTDFEMTSMIRTYSSGGADGTKPLYLLTPSQNAAPLVQQGVGSPGYWSYSVNSVLNSLGRFRDRFQDAQGNGIPLPWADPFHETSMRHNNDSEFITFVEEDNNSLFNDEVFDAPAYNGGDILTNRHDFGGMVGFLDGHVEYYKATVFNYQPSAITNEFVDNTTAMLSPITRMFFPDGGNFASGGD